MNERIKELWIQCVRKHTKDPMNWQNVADEYAELIIRECAKIADDGCGSACFGLGINGAMLKEHFGVK